MNWILSILIFLLLCLILIQRVRLNRTIEALKGTMAALNETRDVVASQSKTIKQLESNLIKLSKKI